MYSTHGETNTRLYRIWAGIKSRCLNCNCNIYQYYGGRGITICPEWTNKGNGYTNFRDWSLNNGYLDNLEIDRANSNGNYEPSNCRWITHKENLRNQLRGKLTSKIVNEIKDLWNTNNYTQKELAKRYNVDPSHISKILSNKKWKN